jgi:acetoin utilization protein AcuB
MLVKDAMSTRIVYVKQDATAAHAMKLMAENNVRRLMVNIDGTKGLYGAITVRDMITKVLATDHDPAKLKVADIMNTNLISVKSTDQLKDVAKLMDEKNVAGLPVIDGTALVGIVTMWDALIALGVPRK